MKGRRAFIQHPASLIPLLLFLLAGCRTETPAIQDDLGRAVLLPQHVRRIVTLAPNLTEMVYAIGSGDRIVGTDDFSNFPPVAQKLPHVGGMQPNIEKIVALQPDLVLATTSGNHPSLAPALAGAGISLYVVRADRLAGIPAAMERLAALLGSTQRASIPRLRAAVARQRRRRSPVPRVLYAVWTNPLYVAGRNTFADDLLVLAGAQNIVQLSGWPQYSLEALVASPPDVIIYPSRSVTPQQVEELLSSSPILRARSVAIGVDEDRFTRPGPRVAEAAEELNRVLDRVRR